MKNLIHKLVSQSAINNFYHLPRAVLANFIYGFLSRKLIVIGVTGTDGKTTTTNMIYQILKDAGKKVSMISTINAVIGDKSIDTGFHVTSPDPFMVQKLIKQAVENGSKYMVLEATSHGLDQFRFWGIKFEIGVITNITHEHLDYHKTFESYKNAKLKLVKNANSAVINKKIGDTGKISGKVISFGLEKGDFNQKEVKINLKIPGDYNIENALSALAVAFVLDIDNKSARKTLENFEGLKGRMEEVKNNRGIKIVVDFAHTPNALENALNALHSLAKGRIISVFGSAGERDVAKRSLMGEVSAKLSDITVITAEDPRGQLQKINQQIVEGAVKVGAKEGINLFVIEDREKAIEFAVNNSGKGGIVGIFGKGHENSMNLDGKKEIPWSDREVVEKILNG